MELPIKFICETCWLLNKDRHRTAPSYIEHEWDDLGSAIEHLKNHSDHKITAETKIEL